MKDSLSGPVACVEIDQQDPKVHCYMGKEDNTGHRKPISDERVRIENTRFFLSGDVSDSITNLSREGKATIALSLGIEYKA